MTKRASLLALAVSLMLFGAVSAPAAAEGDYDTQSVDQMTVLYDIHADGSIQVKMDLFFNFNTEPGHGVFFRLPTRSSVEGHAYDVSEVWASSPTGAPAPVRVEPRDGWVVVWIGDPDQGDIAGVQEYVVTYTLRGALAATMASDLDPSVAPADDAHVADEFSWNVVGDPWNIPFDDVTVIVEANTAADRTPLLRGTGGQHGLVHVLEGLQRRRELHPGPPGSLRGPDDRRGLPAGFLRHLAGTSRTRRRARRPTRARPRSASAAEPGGTSSETWWWYAAGGAGLVAARRARHRRARQPPQDAGRRAVGRGPAPGFGWARGARRVEPASVGAIAGPGACAKRASHGMMGP